MAWDRGRHFTRQSFPSAPEYQVAVFLFACSPTASSAMDVARLTRVVRMAETVKCELPGYRGLSLGLLLQSWPDEVSSGRVARGRSKTAEAQVIRAYVKFVKASAVLAETVTGLDTPDVPLRSASIAPAPEGQGPAVIPQQQHWQGQQAHRGLFVRYRLPRAASTARSALTPSQLHSSALDTRFMDPITSHVFDVSGSNPRADPPTLSTESPQSQPGRGFLARRTCGAGRWLGRSSWRPRGLWALGGLSTCAALWLLFQLLRLFAERWVSTSLATYETTDMSLRFVHFLEDTLDICPVEPGAASTSV